MYKYYNLYFPLLYEHITSVNHLALKTVLKFSNQF